MLSTDVKEFKRERPEGVVTQTGACRFCGQMRTIETLIQWEADDVNEAVTELCSCYDAVEYASKKRKKEKACKAIQRKFLNEPKPWPEPMMNILFDAVPMILEGRLKNLNIDDGEGIKVKLGITSKGDIKVEKVVTRKESEEV